MRNRCRIAATLAATLVGGLAVAAVPNANAASTEGLTAFALTSEQRILNIDVERPRPSFATRTLRGFTLDTEILGIDVRPATGQLIGLGDAGGVYSIDPTPGTGGDVTLISRLNVALDGGEVAIDFNPTVDRLRVVSDLGQNLRVNVDTGATTVDTPLTDSGAMGAAALGVAGAAYTNNEVVGNAATATVLYDIQASTDRLLIQSPANNGTLANVGSLGVDVNGTLGFDIYTHVDESGTAVSNTGIVTTSGLIDRSTIHTIDLETGAITTLGNFLPRHEVIDIAVPLDQDVPAPADDLVVAQGFALVDRGGIITFSSDNPGGGVEGPAITGVPDGGGLNRIVGIDVRPATGELIGVDNQGAIYAIDPATGVATFKSQISVPAGIDFSAFGMDFNPAVDRLRLVSNTGQNLRINVDTGAATVDGPVTTPNATIEGTVGQAYTNNDAAAATGTVLRNIDSLSESLLLQSPPNAGTVAVIGNTGLDITPLSGFDIFTERDDMGTSVMNTGFITVNDTTTARFYEINLETGATELIGDFGTAYVLDITFPAG